MDIMIADADRDFVSSYQKLLINDGHSATAVFDGTQVISRLVSSRPDLVLLGKSIPRVNSRALTERLNKENVPVILIAGQEPDADMLLDSTLPNAFIKLPFFPSELRDKIRIVDSLINSVQQISVNDITVSRAEFLLCGETRVCAEEIEILEALSQNSSITDPLANAFINALNNKLGRLDKKTRIRYVLKEGYRLVMNDG